MRHYPRGRSWVGGASILEVGAPTAPCGHIGQALDCERLCDKAFDRSPIRERDGAYGQGRRYLGDQRPEGAEGYVPDLDFDRCAEGFTYKAWPHRCAREGIKTIARRGARALAEHRVALGQCAIEGKAPHMGADHG